MVPPHLIIAALFGWLERGAARSARIPAEREPAGPYRLAGWSFGGILAYEIASQLIGADEEVDFLGALDTFYEGGRTFADPEATTEFDDASCCCASSSAK